jgi:hypothetical protein
MQSMTDEGHPDRRADPHPTAFNGHLLPREKEATDLSNPQFVLRSFASSSCILSTVAMPITVAPRS